MGPRRLVIAAAAILYGLGVAVDPTALVVALMVVGMAVLSRGWGALTHLVRKPSTKTFNLVDPNLQRVSYFKVSPPIDVTKSSHVHCRVRPARFRIAPPEDLDPIFRAAARALDPDEQAHDEIIERLATRFEAGNFASVHEHDPISPDPISPDWRSTQVFSHILADAAGFDAAREKALVDYLTRSNGFGYNGVFVAVSALKETRDETDLHEVPALEFTLQPTDYYTFRVLSELASKSNMAEFGFPAIEGDDFTEYCAGQFQKFVHASFGIAIAVHTLKDDRLIVTRRSHNTGNPLDEAGKYFMSANEGLNRYDFDPNVEFNLKPVVEWVDRALSEELIGKSEEAEEARKLMGAIRTRCITSAILYLPNMSINLCFYVAIDCTSADIRESQVRARDGRFEAKIIREPRWDAHTGLPRFSPKSIHELIEATTSDGPLSAAWDEGALVTTMLSMLAYGLYR